MNSLLDFLIDLQMAYGSPSFWSSDPEIAKGNLTVFYCFVIIIIAIKCIASLYYMGMGKAWIVSTISTISIYGLISIGLFLFSPILGFIVFICMIVVDILIGLSNLDTIESMFLSFVSFSIWKYFDNKKKVKEQKKMLEDYYNELTKNT